MQINIPQAEAAALLASIGQVLDRSPALLAELGLVQAGSELGRASVNAQAATRILSDPRLLSLVARHAAGTAGLEPLAPRLTRAAQLISQLLAAEVQAQRNHQAALQQPARAVSQAGAAAAAAAAPAVMAGGGGGGGGGLPPDDPPLFRAARAGDCGAVQRELVALQRTQPHLFASSHPLHAAVDLPRDRHGESLLGVACAHGHADLVRMLTSPAFGAHPALPSLRDGATPLHHASRAARADVLRVLLDVLTSAATSAATPATPAAPGTVLAAALNARTRAGETPLHAAAGGGGGGFGGVPAGAAPAAAACALLLGAGAEVSAVTEHGCTALHVASLVAGRSDVAAVLLRAGAGAGAQEFAKHATAAHHAAQSGDPLMLHAILGHVHRDASRRARESDALLGRSGRAAEADAEAAGQAAASALANQAGKRGLVAAHCAAAAGSAAALRVLVSDYGANVHARGEMDGASPLTVWIPTRCPP
jgi:ankyrin repeat protein